MMFLLMRRIAAAALFLAIQALSTGTVFAGSPAHNTRRVEVALLLDGREELIIGSASCKIGEHCELLAIPEVEVKVALRLNRTGEPYIGELTAECKRDCSFSNGRNSFEFRDERQFNLFDGLERHVEILLVQRPRPKIAELFLIIAQN